MKTFYSKQDFVNYATQQIIENNDLIKALEIVASVLPKFDGKVSNKRIKTAIDLELDKVFKTAYFQLELLNGYSRIGVAVRDNDTYKCIRGEGVDYVNYGEWAHMNIDNSTFQASASIEAINVKIQGIKASNRQLQYEMDHLYEIETEYNSIKNRIGEFNKSRSYQIKQLYNFR